VTWFDDGDDPPAALQEGAAFQALSRIPLAEWPLERTLEEVSALARRMLPETPAASVTVVADHWMRTAAFSGALALQLDERQYDEGYGPCLDAAVSGGVIEVSMDERQEFYHDYRKAARQLGVTHSLSVGLPAAGRVIGALNLYSCTGKRFDTESVRVADTFAGFAALLLSTLGRDDDAATAAAQLQAAARTRAVISQAQGVLMARHHYNRDEAMHALLRLSRQHAAPLQRVAQHVVDGACTT
jgi:GAF domain-containing protein